MRTTIMNMKQVAHCALRAERLIAAHVRNDRLAWLRARQDLSGNTQYEQLAFYLICQTLNDVPEKPAGLPDMTWWNVVAIGFTARPGVEQAINLAFGAHLLATCGTAGPWNDAWAKADDDTLRMLIHMVEVAWEDALGDERRAMRALHLALSAARTPHWRRRLRRACAYYRRLPARIRYQYRVDTATASQRPRLWRYLRYLRRNRAYDDLHIPKFRGGAAIGEDG